MAASAIFFADFAAYTYFNPLLQQRAGLTGEQVTLVLLGVGIVGGVTNFTAGRTVRHHLRATMFTAGALVGIGARLITLANGETIVTIVLVLVWGAGFGADPWRRKRGWPKPRPRRSRAVSHFSSRHCRVLWPQGQQSAAFKYNTYGTVGPLLTAAIAGGLGSAAVSGRTAGVDRLDGAATR